MEEPNQNQKLRTKEIKGVIFLALAVFLLLCLFSYSPQDPSFTHAVPPDGPATHNLTGKVGSYTADSLIRLLGFASFLIPLALLAGAFNFFLNPSFNLDKSRLGGFFFFTLSLAGLLGALIRGGVTFSGEKLKAGGLVGTGIVQFLLGYFNPAGTYIILILIFIVSLFFIIEFSLVTVSESFSSLVSSLFKKVKDRLPAFSTGIFSRMKIKIPSPPVTQTQDSAPKKAKPRKIEQTHFDFSKLKSDGKFQLPPLTLLDTPPRKDGRVKRDQLITNSRILEKKLADFGVEARVVEVMPGPVITMYELEPAPGVKINRITTLSDDLALALMAPSIRILAPIPGKSVIGIEIPNLKREPVLLKEVLDHEVFANSSLRLPVALGVDFIGAPVITDLARMPHLLIAGTTGSGKSVALNAMICSILFKANPDDVKFLMIDPKRLELSSYEGIPHLMHPVVVDPKKASQVLRWTVEEMERRYRVISLLGVKSIDAYNELAATGAGSKAKVAHKTHKQQSVHGDDGAAEDEAEVEHVHLPYIVVVIDELADLMMVASRDVEESLTRLAQMARAAGIHLILATQRPSVDVITGLIKANFPTRISFKVSSKVDSRTIIDQPGAELLLGAGDMLFIPPGTSRLTRIHGAYLSDAEISRVVDFLKLQGQPTYDASIDKFDFDSAQSHKEDDGYDEKYDEAVALVSELGQASISLVQRYMKIGYNRAARLIEQMEREGIVGPSDGVKPRKVLIRKLPQ
ncbi:MAG TPA: DNA translocase FtsK 4TM domain-containing protein [Smithellaceae bacterium]|jgi:S-DNA-T family DNA segregation ATPase FtsK/SpoIIIE|nr:DNA translocase FtsK 4TM domain-containing protein [Syntrophaceae bacterium]HPL97541.1 DNA translocase FtsK 4TM domain-containing protein [Smithellaceae bacterium]HPV49603.1 DNA translocase FtsK 4TM domain-containing protein [Smithellaceae bacterium]